jgi:hypothetical protein
MGSVARDSVILPTEAFVMKRHVLTLIEHQSSSENLWALFLCRPVLHYQFILEKKSAKK